MLSDISHKLLGDTLQLIFAAENPMLSVLVELNLKLYDITHLKDHQSPLDAISPFDWIEIVAPPAEHLEMSMQILIFPSLKSRI